MSTKASLWRWLVQRPLKIIRNFLRLQIILSTLAAIIIGFCLPNEPITNFMFLNYENNEILFSKDQLSSFNGEKGKPLYLALLGSVYDVTRGIKHYGPGCTYNFFVGRDASVAFITGEFEKFDPKESDDVLQYVKGKDLLGLANWKRFYDKDYVYKGKLIGRFYDEKGKLTEYHHKYLAALKHAEKDQQEIEQLNKVYPDCNIEWSEQKGSHVWCTKTSGGINREWIGYPRKLFQVGSNNFRCACIRKEDLNSNTVMLKEYENCDSNSYECYYRVD